jgi:hypothetical protein
MFSVVVLVAGLTLPITVQVSGQVPGQAVPGSSTTLVKPKPVAAAHVPYTAEYKIKVVKTLFNGSTITQETTRIEALDSEGRRMDSVTNISPVADRPSITSVNVNDPVAHTHSFWTSQLNKATVDEIASGTSRSGCHVDSTQARQQSTSARREKPVVEDLGTSTFQGVEASGRRTTFTTPVGEVGNSEALVHVVEIWHATQPGLNNVIVRQIDDNAMPESGKRTEELVNFTPGEPDASLFQPPADYVVETRGQAEVSCSQPRTPSQ